MVPNNLKLHDFSLSLPTLSSMATHISMHMHLGWEELLGLSGLLAACEDDYLIASSQLYEAEKRPNRIGQASFSCITAL